MPERAAPTLLLLLHRLGSSASNLLMFLRFFRIAEVLSEIWLVFVVVRIKLSRHICSFERRRCRFERCCRLSFQRRNEDFITFMPDLLITSISEGDDSHPLRFRWIHQGNCTVINNNGGAICYGRTRKHRRCSRAGVVSGTSLPIT